MSIAVTLVDLNPKMIQAWRDSFEANPEVNMVQGSMLDLQVDAWVTPTNSHGAMDGGLDAAIKNHFGPPIEQRVQQEIAKRYGGVLPIGHATCVPAAFGGQGAAPKYLISTPTMHTSSEDVSDTLNVALACAAAFQAARQQNVKQADSIKSIALPGLGANTGRTPVEICADLMWTAYHLFKDRQFFSFVDMRGALEQELGELGPSTGKPAAKPLSSPLKPAQPKWQAPPPSSKPAAKEEDDDFDDF